MKRRAPWSIARLFVLLVLAVVMVSMMGTVAFAQEADNGADKECYLNGDMNVDGSFDTEDAIYTLFYTFFGEGMYPINQDCDINADESVDTNDAIALLYAAFFKDTGLYPEYEKYGETAHDYYDPAWSWEETPEGVAAKVTLQCACGEGSHELDAVVTAGQTVAATCTAAGSRAYTAAATVDGETFTATYTQVIAAAGHTAGEAAYDDNQHYTLCANCGEKLNAASHSWEADGEASAATCKVAAVQNYKCSCGATKSEELGFAEHAYEYVEDVLVEGETCQYAKKHVCADCGEVKLTDQYANHNYVASVKEATCQADGEKVYKCSLCGAVEKTETIAKSEDKHIWNDGVEAAGVITYSCTVDGCDATKTAVTTSEDGTVSKDALQSADQLEVGDATLEMDETVKEGLDADKEIQITVDTMDVEEAEKNLGNALTEEQKEQIGDNKVYDFNMSYSDGQKVDFDGWITVSLPYTLAEGEDVDAIDVWYIADDGTLEKQTATYSNGYVTFQTNHFSYYTVTRLTPAERCERYGHIWTDANKAATCTADGYTKQVCQRCAKEANLVVIEKTGHNYQTTTTAATCEKFGSVVEKCANCGHTKSTVTPALGHAMQLSETVDATCDAAGKKVYTCANGCGHTKEEAIPQLTHSYKKDETKTVEATCTTGGYDIHVCEHCGNEIKKNETTPTGHHYGTDNAVWNWSADDTEATLVLTCDHECGSTKELAATVNIVKATCLGNGSVKASVFYNNKSYTDEKAGASATGHKPASEWSTTEDVHYYKCEACGAKLEEATHDMDNGVVTKEPTCTGDGLKVYTCAVCGYTEEEILPATGKHAFDDGKVTKEPTCTEAGLKVYTCAVCGETKEEVIDASGRHTYDDGVVTKEPTCKEKGTKVYTCTVCGFTREESIAATGNHSYVNGICSVCGKEESACNHYKTTATLIDISAFDICKGMEIYEVKCECGQNRTLMVEKFACEMITISEGYNEDKTSMTYIEECKNCGLRAESGYYIEKAPDACRAQYVEWGKLIMNGVTVAEFSVVREESEEHPVYIVGEKTVLTDKGMCDLTILTVSCPCGERTETNVSSACEWSYKGDVAYCTVCGAQRTYGIGEIIEDGCMFAVEYIYRYFNKNGEEVYTYNQKHTEYRHNYEATDYQLYGDSCEDGIWVEYTCTECGEVHDEYNEGGYHPMVESTITDLEDAKICASAHIQYTCACGEAKEECLHYNVDDEICQWAQVITPDGSVEGDAEYYRCSICGAIRTDVYETTDKDANCQYREKRTVIYVDANGNQIVTGMDMNTYTQHNMKYDYELKGESCEDGVIVTEYCADCGMSDYWEMEHHEVYEEFYDLADYGFCGGYVRYYSCPCGEYAWAEIEPWGCDWMGMGDEGWTYHECRNCGGIWETWYEEVVIDACHSQMDYTHSFRMGDKEVLNIAYVENIDNHRWVYELALLGETCNDGIYVKRTCLTCGETDEFGEEHIGHELWAIDRQIVSEGQLCGTVEKVTYACACGERTRTEYEWYDGECNFMHTGFGEEGDSYIYTCSECGAVRYERNFHEQVPGGTACQRQHRWEYTYSLKDEVLFVETGVGYYNEHDWIYDLTLMGETCEDGVAVKRICAHCGEGDGEWTTYDHETFRIAYYDLTEFGACGGEFRVTSCGCGENKSYSWWTDCNWTEHVDLENGESRICGACGLTATELWLENEIIDDCHYREIGTITLSMGEKTLVEAARVWTYEDHDYEYSFELLGETCEDGVVVNRTCTKCGYSDRYETRGHEEFVLEEYNLADYGFCEGYLRVFGCACGEIRDVDYDAACTWYGMGGFGPGENSFSETCDNCGMVFTMTWNDGEALDSCHTKVDRTVSFAKGDVAIRAAYHEIQTHHRIVHSLSFWEGSSSCQEGFSVTERCLNCGLEFGGWGNSGNHPTYIVDRQYITVDGDICGTVERLIYSCACGEETHEEYLFDGCQFQEIYDEERGEWIFACVDCGVERIYEYAEVPVEGEPCKVEATRTYAFVQNGTVLVSYTTKQIETSHETNAVLTLLVEGGTCDDGYTVTWVCKNCGEVTGNSGTNYGCNRYRVNREVLVPEGVLCGELCMDTYSCACGKENHTQTYWEGESCSFRWDVEKQADVCANCGVERCSTTDRKYIEGTVCEYQCTEVVTFLRDGKELYSYTRTYKTISHNSVAQLTLVNPDGTCDDGWTRAWVCADCGMDMGADEQVYYGCQTHRISEELLASKDVLCGDLYQFTNRCACGKVTETGRYWSNGSCDFRETGYDESEQCYTYTCEKCGAYRRDYSEDTQVDRCHRQHTWTDIYHDANGNQLFTESGSNVYHSPSWIYTYQLNGKTCDEGYTRFGKCAYCDETYEDTQVYYGCSTNRVEIVEIVADSDKVCGPIELSVYSCACGKESHWNIDRDCRFSWLGYDEVAQADRYQCADCGLIYTEKDETIRQPGTCLVTEIIDRVYTVTDGEATVEVGSINRVFERREHSSVATLTLVDGATSCEDGYYTSQHCIYCDYTWSSDEIRYDHNTWRIAYYALEDCGKCGGSVEGWSCACGKNENWNYWDGGCNYIWTGEKNEYGVSERYCETCNTYSYMDDVSEYVREECRDRSTLYARLIRDGETLLNLVEEYEQERHTMIVVGYDGTCGDDNITVYQQCYYCGEQGTENWGGGHPGLTLDCLDLTAAGTCGGFIRQHSCPCGEENGIWWEDIQCVWNYTMWEEQENDGVLYYTRTRTCNTCGLVVKETYHDEESDENCRYNRIYTYEFWMNDKLLKSYNETNRYEDHNYTLTNVELQGESCEDGVIFTYTCMCGASHTNHYSSHVKYWHEDKTIDLSQYGSVCGCELEFHGCACGAEQSYEISNQNCDIDSRYVDVWVEGALNEGQETTEGWRSAYSYAYTYTCAVTDPQCGLKIRMGSIWLKGDNCTAVQYQYWQLGYQEIYDETTGETTYSWEKEIVIPTGNTVTFHDYAHTSGTNYLDDGTQVNYQDYLCNDCGSSWHEEDHYLNGNHTYFESVKINTLDNGETKQVRTVAEYGFLHNGSAYETLRTWNRINADGSEWWEKRETSYTTADACKYVCTETNSDGYSYTRENDHYFTSTNWTWIEEPTCSQPGVEQRTETCQLCNEVVDVELYDANPHRHSWYWDFEKECYFCSRCGLENSNGADGTIVVEDLTAGYGNGTDYVVGYWNQGNGEFTVYASVILDDVTDDNDEIVLTGIEFTYLTREENEINAISTNQAAIQEAAKAAIADAGYTGSYAIRIAFVPADSDGTLDYAITFDSQTA